MYILEAGGGLPPPAPPGPEPGIQHVLSENSKKTMRNNSVLRANLNSHKNSESRVLRAFCFTKYYISQYVLSENVRFQQSHIMQSHAGPAWLCI